MNLPRFVHIVRIWTSNEDPEWADELVPSLPGRTVHFHRPAPGRVNLPSRRRADRYWYTGWLVLTVVMLAAEIVWRIVS